MAKTPLASPTPAANPEDAGAAASQAAICHHVLAVLGRPLDFLRITVRRVTGDGYRVNVLVGPDLTAARIAHSYFVTADNVGSVKGSSPGILKVY